MMKIRRAGEGDLPTITAIYNQAVLSSTATFDTEPRSLDDRRQWFHRHGPLHPILVADLCGCVVGWASLSPWSERQAYTGTAEVSVYVDEGYRGRGIGKELLQALIRAGREAGLHTVIAQITADNIISLHLHKRLGFERVGVLREVGCKFGRLLDVVLLQLIYR